MRQIIDHLTRTCGASNNNSISSARNLTLFKSLDAHVSVRQQKHTQAEACSVLLIKGIPDNYEEADKRKALLLSAR